MKRFKLAARAIERSQWDAVHGRDGWPDLRYAIEIIVFGPKRALKRDDARMVTA